MKKGGTERILALLKSEGKRFTTKRALVYQIMQESESHLPAEEIYLRAKAINPRISLSTVYRTLNILKGLGLVRELHLDEEHHHYELVEGATHYHMICSQCGKIEEFKSALVGKLVEELEKNYGFETKSVHIDFVGLCANCRNKT